ncbi:GNAT family N-acetyltransferase [uncultured Spirosoma sp.]|uniref:GNAT family N-acetyltransferase n=1 Tax=uncultured Spirosoma sp. TaxID=278208 RepID=UPI0025893624|nr:GNAT family N-acetyltransferase [uncultured Spirosoma sp.]
MQQTTFTGIRPATTADRQAVIAIISSSFQDDPCFAWLLEPSDHPEKVRILTTYLVDETFANGQVYITDDQMGAALWHTNQAEPMSWLYVKRNLSLLWQLGIGSIRRCLRMQQYKTDHFPTEGPYAYLACIGVLPQAQGKGLANRLLTPVLQQYTAQRIPIFLETANATNVDIYERKGFSLTDTVQENDLSIYFMRHN